MRPVFYAKFSIKKIQSGFKGPLLVSMLKEFNDEWWDRQWGLSGHFPHLIKTYLFIQGNNSVARLTIINVWASF